MRPCPWLALLLLVTSTAFAQQRTVDYRYAPATWYTPLGLVDDAHKTLVDDRGRLLYDFGPGPYVRARTTVAVGVNGAVLEPVAQRMDEPRVPIVETTLADGPVRVHQTAFAALPAPGAAPPSAPENVERLEGLVGTLGWATPPPGTDPAFRNVAWGANRPVRYRLAVEPGSTARVALGFAESYRTRPGQRVFDLEVEGAAPVRFDPLEAGAPNEPEVIVLDATDTDGDGRLDVAVQSAEYDPNTYLNVLWLFPSGTELDADALVRGALDDRALLKVDAGREQATATAPRADVLQAAFDDPDAVPVVEIATGRVLKAHADGLDEVRSDGVRPILRTVPAPERAEATDDGWRLVLPRGTQAATVYVLHGAGAALPPPEAAAEAARAYWLESAPIPYDRLQVPDADLQALLAASLRTVYQAREVVDGAVQFQPGMALYRGLWVHDAAYLIDTALMLGDTTSARQALEGVLAFQAADGQVRVMRPFTMNRETALTAWLMTRYARLADDDAWLRHRWGDLQRAVRWIEARRAETLADPEAPYYGLMPPAFADGGLGGVHAEYSGVYWMLTALDAVVEAARRLGYDEDAAAWQALFDDAHASWQRAAARDQRLDAHGHRYLPARVGAPADDDAPPPQAQWMLIEALTLSDYLSPSDSLVLGTRAMLAGAEVDGLVRGVGWMEEGIWAYFGAFYSLLHLWTDQRDEAADALYAFANHASPLGAWVEEQLPKGEGRRTAGDVPHAWGSSLMVRLTRMLIAAEHGDDLVLLDGVPTQWLTPGDTLALRDAPTLFGPLTIEATVDPFGRHATVHIEPVGAPGQAGALRISLRALRELGYVAEDGTPLPDERVLPWGEASTITVRRP